MNPASAKYPWAANKYKEARAIKDLKAELGKEPTEAQVKERYIVLAGLVVEKDTASNVQGAPDDVAEITVNKESKKVKKTDTEDESDKPAKKTKTSDED